MEGLRLARGRENEEERRSRGLSGCSGWEEKKYQKGRAAVSGGAAVFGRLEEEKKK